MPSPAPTLRRRHWQPVPSLRTEAADAQGRGQDPAAQKTPTGLPPLGSQDTLGSDVAGQEGGPGSAAPRTVKGHGLLTPSPACFLSKPLLWTFLAWALGGARGDRPSPPSVLQPDTWISVCHSVCQGLDGQDQGALLLSQEMADKATGNARRAQVKAPARGPRPRPCVLTGI